MASAPVYSVKVEGLGEALTVPDRLDHARRVFPANAARALAIEVRRRLPHGASPPHLADMVVGKVEHGMIVVETVGSPYARALEDGATILPRKNRATKTGRKPALRFVIDGKVIFARRVVIQRNRPGGRPFRRALATRSRVIQHAFDTTMEKI